MIGRVYNWLFDAHLHEWEIMAKQNYEQTNPLYENQVVHCGTMYTLRCKKCGDISSRKVGL